jgi:hypothetical protein
MTSFFDILLETEDITVLGPPQAIDVSTGIGSPGRRGARIIVGSGNPNTPGVVSSGEDVQTGDIFLNNSTGSNFSWLYQRISGLAAETWQPIIRLQPPLFVRHFNVDFDTTGSAILDIPIAEIISDITISNVDNFVVQVTPINFSNPVAVSIKEKIIELGDLKITLNAIEYNEPSWNSFEGIMKLGIIISVI